MRNSKLIKLICLIICLFMAISLLGACSDQGGSSSEPSTSDVSSEPSDNSDPEVEIEDPEDNGDNNDGFDQPTGDSGEDNWPEDEEGDDEYYGDDVMSETLYVYNKEAPISTEYRGMSSSIYHAFGHMENDNTGRVYTKEMMDLELSRLQDSGVRFARTRYTTLWAWDGATGGWNWDSPRMTYYWNYCRNLAKHGVSVVQSVGWHLGCHTHLVNGSIDEHGYITQSEKYTDDHYGETEGYEKYAVDYVNKYFSDAKVRESSYEEYKRMAKESFRLGEAHAQLLLEAKARGIHNISHLLYFTEPSYATTETKHMPDSSHPAFGFEGGEPDEYIFIVKTIQKKLKERGVYDMVEHVGPNQGSIQHGDGLLRYMLERGCADMFDVWTAHFYPTGPDASENVYYSIIDPVFESYVQPLKDVGVFRKVEFWVDEFYCRSANAKLGFDSPWAGLQMAVGGIIAQQRGINNISLWQIFDQLWTDQTNTGGEFINGIHACGSAPSLFDSSIPRRQYYSTGLFATYNGYPYWFFNYYDNHTEGLRQADNDKHFISFGYTGDAKNAVVGSVDGVVDYKKEYAQDFTTPGTLYLFHVNRPNAKIMEHIMNIYYVKLYENNVLIRHFVPVPRGLAIGDFIVPENGMWDIVEQRFYGNMGTGEFVYGVDGE